MDTPSQVFGNFLGIDDGEACYAAGFDNGRQAPTLDHDFSEFSDRVVNRKVPVPSLSKVKMGRRLGMWDPAEQTTEIALPDMIHQPMFAQPGLYAQDAGNTIIALRDRAIKTPSKTPELVRSGRQSSRIKSSSSLKSEGSGSSNSLSASTDITVPDLEPPRKRTRSKKIKKEAPEDNKRNKFLERNRVAASKCREKKKQFVSELEENKIALERQHAQLQDEYTSLVAEVGTLKHQLMTHAKCNDGNIDKWLANEARKFVQTSDIFGHQRAAAVQAQQENPFATHTRQSSASSIQHGAGPGSFSSAGERRGSLAYSQGTSLDYGQEDLVDPWTASSTYTSPTEMVFSTMSPQFDSKELGMNFDHMPDDMFDTAQ